MNSSPALACASPFSGIDKRNVCLKRRLFTLLEFFAAWSILFITSANGAELTNGSFRIELGTSPSGLPIVTQGNWVGSDVPAFTDSGDSLDLTSWLPETLIPDGSAKIKSDPWKLSENDSFVLGQACANLSNGIKLTWIIELSKVSSLFRLHVRLTNHSVATQTIDWFPAWAAAWQIPNGADWVRSWPALSYNRVEKELSAGARVRLGSELQSSDVSSDGEGATPYWTVGGKSARLYFGLEWCGGWSAKLQGEDNGFSFVVRLPSSDTQLVLNSGEAVDGPSVIVMPATGSDDSESRRAWIGQTRVLANSVYHGERPSFPLTYNHWYSIGFDVNADFLRRQIDSMGAYGFDAFIVDAGWYDAVGSWQPDPSKFQPGEFESILKSISDNGVKVGIWSCPQFTTAKRKRLPPEVDDPPYYEDFVGGYLLDLADSGFTDRLTSHVAMLRDRYLADWWKYDQTFFSATTRAGAMRNVIAFQDALLAVRQANPDLAIENCQSGGRMINALTTMATQATWLSDGGLTGLRHAQQNIQLALGALDFLSPWAVYRWTNNLDQMDPQNDELTRLYCRSAMAGTWGISADLSKIPDHQQSMIVQEIQNYRRMNPIKLASLYELLEPTDGAPAAGVTFYDGRRKRAAVILYRWDSKQAFAQLVAIDKLRTTSSYLVTDVDTGASTTVTGDDLLRDGVGVQFGANRMSALLFIEAAN